MRTIIYLVSAGIALCLSSQAIKVIFNRLLGGNKAVKMEDFFTDGHYPSSHTSFVTGLTLITWMQVIYCSDFDNRQIYIWIATIFSAVTAIVIRDALGVRYTVQCLCDAMLIMIDNIKHDNKVDVERLGEIADMLNKKSGHRPYEVIGGGIWGLQMGLFISSIYYYNFKLIILSGVLMLAFILVSYRYNKKVRIIGKL